MSQYLPAYFEPQSAVVALIAGQGSYPKILKQKILEQKIALKLFAFDGETSADLIAQFSPENVTLLKVGHIGALLKSLKNVGATHAIMAGRITPKKLFHNFNFDLKALTLLAKLRTRNAETIFGAVADEMGKIGVNVLDARTFMDDHIATPGNITGSWKLKQPWLEHGLHIAEGIAQLDVGQSVVVRKGTVLAVEAFEGTDAMLARAGSFKTDDALFVKTIKRNQDYRFDVPVFGEQTVENLHAANIRYVALKAGGVIMLDKSKVIAAAQRHRMAILGY